MPFELEFWSPETLLEMKRYYYDQNCRDLTVWYGFKAK